MLANEERARLMQQSGIEECSWMTHLPALDRLKPEELERRLREVEAHAKACPTCQRREAYAVTLPPLPPLPLGFTLRVLAGLTDGIRHLPKWARPAAVGALVIGGITLIRTVFLVVLRRVPPSTALLLTVGGAIAVGAYGGAVGGLAYALVRERVRRLGRVGDYLTGLTCAYAYFLAFGIPLALFTREEMFRQPVGWVIWVFVATALGLVIGHSWFGNEANR
ncbi:MAG TPA: hypothetical protein VM736_16390 [Gemmatimonadales bacterium]|nr:hypothetical protein [Gemmatimonadales bacterium]